MIEIFTLMTLAMSALADAADQPRGLVRHGMSDQDLWRLIVTGGNPLQGTSLDQAVREDPRRIDAMIRQAYYRAMHRKMPTDPMSAKLDEGLYLVGMQAVRNASGGAAPTMPLISVHEENWYNVLGGTAHTWPPIVRQILRRDWAAIATGFAQGRQIAHKAEVSASSQGLSQDAQEWVAFQDVLKDMEEALRHVVTTGETPEIPARAHRFIE